ncbi:hypothetical protein VTK73DRAFT_525 [Phialemonium thermophilum]|uniref:Uncharacterized protein n=1 Tax=Phialemonium thermophilum TaxID=223376 RepID=A0ABR3Y5B3_9PEZI
MPQTPLHSRHASGFELDCPSVASSPVERRQSRSSSFREPSTPTRGSFNHQDGLDIGVFSSGGMGAGVGGGLGNLADELAEALSDGEGDEYYDEDDGVQDISFEIDEAEPRKEVQGTRDSGVDVESPSSSGEMRRDKSGGLALPSPAGRGHHRRSRSDYDGSEYGSESDLDSPGMPTSLVAKIDTVESLARRGTENNGGPSDGAFKRVTEGLRELGSQAGIEGCASRLITAHSALTTHLTHQTRQLHSLTFPLLSPLAPPPDPDTIEALLPMLVTLSEAMPRPSTAALSSLAALHSLTADLVQTLNYLSDTLHMSRQTTTTATRRLRSARELVAEMRRDEELREEGERWIARGNWNERLAKRECAHVCGDVVGGFEEVCNGWRARLLAQADSAAQA